jgi:predicted small secreted protein
MKLFKSIGVLAIVLLVAFSFAFVGCNTVSSAKPDAEKVAAQKKQETARGLMKKQPGTQIRYSMDRKLLDEKLKRFNDPNKMTYCYIFMPNGQTLEMTIIGKMASASKRLAPTKKLIRLNPGSNEGYDFKWEDLPDEMGVYGSSSGSGKLALSTFGTMLEVGGFFSYLYSEVPLVFTGLDTPIVKFEAKLTDAERAGLLKDLKAMQAEAKTLMRQ